MIHVFSSLLAVVLTVFSPDGRNEIRLDDADGLRYSVLRDGRELVSPSAVSLAVRDRPFAPEIVDSKPFRESGVLKTPVYKKAEITLEAKGLHVRLSGGYGVDLIARDDGVAYRFVTDFPETNVCVVAERADVVFPSADVSLWAGYPDFGKEGGRPGYISNWEPVYTNLSAGAASEDAKRLMALPLVACFGNGVALSVSESDLRDYPGWLLQGAGCAASLRGVFAPEPIEERCGGRYHHEGMTRHGYLAATAGKRTYPWRLFMLADDALSLSTSDAVYALAEPCRIADTSWIRPGLAQWEWWHDWNLSDVPFRAGKNTETYFHYIDFAAEHGVPYVVMDGGWSADYRIMNAIPEIDLRAVAAHAVEKGVGLVLWSPWAALIGCQEEACRAYSAIGIRGFKLDGICRNDRYLTKYLEETARIAAKYRMVIDYHGVAKPTGLSRTYPNILTYEGVHGLENTKWEGDWMPRCDFPRNDLTSLFCRMTAGPVDYTPGAMRNFTTNGYHFSYSEPGSCGTRSRQLALYTLFESPLQMLCDSPSLYRANETCFGFMCRVPTVWDELRPLAGRIGEYVALARRSGKTWYVGAVTDSTAREIDLDFGFLGAGTWDAEIFEDGPNADRNATDYRRRMTSVRPGERLHVKLAPGGGWTARLVRRGADAADVVIENGTARLVLSPDATVRSLTLKRTGEELLDQTRPVPFASVTQDRPFNNEVKLTFPNKRTTYRANRVRREGQTLFVGFEHVSYEAKVDVREADGYFLFALSGFELGPKGANELDLTYPPADVVRFVQLPVRNRRYFGDWMNVVWDEKAAVAVMGADPFAWIEAERPADSRLLLAEAHRDLGFGGTCAAVVAAETPQFMDAVDRFEADLGLPRGVRSRRSEDINRSIYWTSAIRPASADAHIEAAKACGFTKMLIYYSAVAKGAEDDDSYGGIGEYELRDEYHGDLAELRQMLDKIKAAGISPGLHVLQTFIGFKSRYVTPVADPRLNLKRHFTLARPLGTDGGDVFVQEDPSLSPTNANSRILAFGGELLSYEGFSTVRPYRFTGVRRGAKKTRVVPHPAGQIGGVLDVCEFAALSCYIDQRTDLQDEIAAKIARLYDAGFDFMYCDGSEGVNVPQGIYVPAAQYRVWQRLGEKPRFMEGAAKAHFSWHHLSGANAFDVFPPEIFKAMIVRWPQYEAPLMRQNFSRLNFGWWRLFPPGADIGGKKTVGTQMDMWEFGASRSVAWDCPVTLGVWKLDRLAEHPRKDDLFRVLRQWEDVRIRKLLTPSEKEALKSSVQEHHLYCDRPGHYELHPMEMLPPAPAAPHARGFVFERKGHRCLAYWNTAGSGRLRLVLDDASPDRPLEALRYVETDHSRDAVVRAWTAAVESDFAQQGGKR